MNNIKTQVPTMNPKTSVLSPCFRSYARLAIVLAAFAGYTAVSYAATVTLTASDANGFTSFNTGLNWSDTFAPSAGNDYSVGSGATLRTPATTGDFTFAGNSLTIGAGGASQYQEFHGGCKLHHQ